jgi:hypothetical protein
VLDLASVIARSGVSIVEQIQGLQGPLKVKLVHVTQILLKVFIFSTDLPCIYTLVVQAAVVIYSD